MRLVAANNGEAADNGKAGDLEAACSFSVSFKVHFFFIWRKYKLTRLETLEELANSQLSSVDNGTSSVEDLEVTLDRSDAANGVEDRADNRAGNRTSSVKDRADDGASSVHNITNGVANDVTLERSNFTNSCGLSQLRVQFTY